MEKYSLRRTGDRALAFEGELLAEASSRATSGPGENRWYEMALYQTKGGAYVVGLGYSTQWEGEEDQDWAWHADTADAVVAALKAHDPLSPMMGFPPGQNFAEKQLRIEKDLRMRFSRAVSELLAHVEPENIA